MTRASYLVSVVVLTITGLMAMCCMGQDVPSLQDTVWTSQMEDTVISLMDRLDTIKAIYDDMLCDDVDFRSEHGDMHKKLCFRLRSRIPSLEQLIRQHLLAKWNVMAIALGDSLGYNIPRTPLPKPGQ